MEEVMRFSFAKHPFGSEVVITAHDPEILFNYTFGVNLNDQDFELSLKNGIEKVMKEHKRYSESHKEDFLKNMQTLKRVLSEAGELEESK